MFNFLSALSTQCLEGTHKNHFPYGMEENGRNVSFAETLLLSGNRLWNAFVYCRDLIRGQFHAFQTADNLNAGGITIWSEI